MDRKDFFNKFIPSDKNKNISVDVTATEATATANNLQPAAPESTLTPYTGSWTENEMIHLLKRLSFGAVKEDVDYFKTKSFNEAVDEMLNTKNTNVGFPLKNYVPDITTVPRNDPDWSIAVGRTWVNTFTWDGNVNFYRHQSVKAWWFDLMIKQSRSIEEKMMLFLSSFLTIQFGEVNNGIYCYKYLNTLRTHATGNYKTLVKAITIEPSMLFYLNGVYNKNTAPDENYARELQELFTVGKGPHALFTEADVQAAAKVLTGFTVNAQGNVYFEPYFHDTGNKTFSAFYNNTQITGRSGANGQQELDDLINMLFATNEAAKFICRRIYRFFVYGVISADVEANVITPMANLLRTGNYELKPVLSLLFKSEHFFDVLTQGAIIKSPLDFIIGMIRETKMKFPPSVNITALYNMYATMIYQGATMDQNLGDPPNVAGWQAYYLDPVYDKFWINTDTYAKRVNHILFLISGYTYSNQTVQINWIDFTKRMSNPSDPNALIQDFNTYLLRMPLTLATRNTIKTQTLLSGQSSDAYWINAWNAYTANPNNQLYFSDVNNRLLSLIYYFMNLEEFHLM